MPHPLDWRDDWSLGIPELDEDHRALFESLALLVRRFGRRRTPRAGADDTGADAEALFAALTALGERVREHFQREEAFMLAFDFDGIGDHRSEHALLMAEYADMLREWREQGRRTLDEPLQEAIRQWVLDHILGADRDFADTWFSLSDHGWAEVEWSPMEVGAMRAPPPFELPRH